MQNGTSVTNYFPNLGLGFGGFFCLFVCFWGCGFFFFWWWWFVFFIIFFVCVVHFAEEVKEKQDGMG